MVCCCCCSLGTIKCLLLFFNIILALGGGLLVFVGVVIQWNMSEYGQFIPDYIAVPGYLLIVVGIALLIVAIIGLCGVVKESHWVYTLSLLILFALEVTGGVLAFSLQGQMDKLLMTTMKESMKVYSSPGPEGEISRQAWNTIQKSFQCCGTESPLDWTLVVGLIKPPDSCACSSNTNSCNAVEGIFKEGCFPKVSHWFRLIESILGYLALSFAFVQLLLAIFVLFCGKKCCL